MHPQAEAQEPGGDDRKDDQPVSDERGPGHGGHDHRNHAGGGQEDDVDLRMAEEPEQVLPQQWIAALFRDEERPVKGALQLQQQRGEDHRGEGEHDHQRENEHHPGIDRQLVERLAGSARLEHSDDDLDGAGNRGDLDEADPQQPEIGVDARRVLEARQRRIHEPAAVRRQPEENAAEEGQTADQISPEGIGRQARKRKIACGLHVGQKNDADRFHHRHGEEKHHDRAVHREQLVVQRMPDQVVLGHGQLRAHDQGEDAGEHEEQKRSRDVEQADEGIVDGGEDAPAPRRLPGPLQSLQLVLRARHRIGKVSVIVRLLRSVPDCSKRRRRHLRLSR